MHGTLVFEQRPRARAAAAPGRGQSMRRKAPSDRLDLHPMVVIDPFVNG